MRGESEKAGNHWNKAIGLAERLVPPNNLATAAKSKATPRATPRLLVRGRRQCRKLSAQRSEIRS